MKQITLKVVISTAVLMSVAIFLVGCGGGNTATAPAPVATSSDYQSNPNPPTDATQNGGVSAPSAPGRPIAGTVSKYDASTKVLTLQSSDGSLHTFTTGNASIIKSEKITTEELQPLLSKESTVAVTGQKGSDGSYSAQILTVMAGGLMGGGQPNGATPSGGQANPGIILREASLNNGQLTGKTVGGQPAIVHLSGTTILLKQTRGTSSDLQPGQNALVAASSGQGNASNDAFVVVVGTPE